MCLPLCSTKKVLHGVSRRSLYFIVFVTFLFGDTSVEFFKYKLCCVAPNKLGNIDLLVS